jgi:Na+/melibiose symporter-like transporter
MRADLPVATRLLYGLGAAAFGLKDGAINAFLLLFYNQVMGLPADRVGLALMLSLMVDAVADPVIGHVSDRTRTRLGRRHPYLYAAMVPAAAFFYALWNPPAHWGEGALTAYLMATLIGARVSIAVNEIPSSAMVPELTDDYGRRTALLAYRQIAFWVAGIGGLILAFATFFRSQGNGVPGQLVASSYARLGFWFSLGILLAILISAVGTQRAMLPTAGSAGDVRRDRPRWHAVAATLRNRSLLAVLASGLLCSVAIGLSTSLNIYLYTFFWHLTAGQLSLLTSMYLVAAVFAFAAAQTVLRKVEKRGAAMICGIVFCLGIITPIGLRLLGWFPGPGSTALVPALAASTLIVATSAICFGIVSASMLSDVVEDAELASGERSEGLIFSVSMLIQKAVSGTGVFAAGLLLAAIDFPAHAKPGTVPASLVSTLALAYVATYAVFYLAGIAALGGYRLTRVHHQANLDMLAERRATAASVEAMP